MNKQRKEAYKHLLYCLLSEIRSGNNAPKIWNLFDWIYSFNESKKNKEIANDFHNLAFFIREDFNGFDESIFWDTLKLSKYKLYNKYKRIFDAYLNGEQFLF